MTYLEALQAITILGLFTNNIKNSINQLSSFSVMTFGPVVSGTGLSKHEIIRSKDLANGTGSDTIHGTGFKIHEYRTRDVPSTGSLVVIHIDPLQLNIG